MKEGIEEIRLEKKDYPVLLNWVLGLWLDCFWNKFYLVVEYLETAAFEQRRSVFAVPRGIIKKKFLEN